MGDYISQSDLEESMSYQKLRMLTDDANAKAVDASIVTKAITAAEGEVNSYVGKQYTVPVVAPIPEPISRWSTVLASLFLHQRRDSVSESLQAESTDVRRQLRDVANGKITLDIDDSGAVESDGFEPDITSEDRVFTRTNYSGW